jgi:hypothetical protein
MPEMSVRLRPKSVFGINRNPRSAYSEISVRFPPKYTIWRLFAAGLIDEDYATLVLLAVAIGTRRRQTIDADRRDGAPKTDPGV